MFKYIVSFQDNGNILTINALMLDRAFNGNALMSFFPQQPLRHCCIGVITRGPPMSLGTPRDFRSPTHSKLSTYKYIKHISRFQHCCISTLIPRISNFQLKQSFLIVWQHIFHFKHLSRKSLTPVPYCLDFHQWRVLL